MKKISFFTFIFVLIIHYQCDAQLRVTDTLSVQDLITDKLLGNGITVSGIKSKGKSRAFGYFTAKNTKLGIDSGIIITNGSIYKALGPNNNDSASVINNDVGDTDLQLIGNNASYDATALEFDFIPESDSVKFTYVFGSEEYLEFVNRGFNDAFGFFVTGPGLPSGGINLALVPGTNLPITINNINPSQNSAYYKDTKNDLLLQYDGFTVPLSAGFKVTPCGTYHIKMAISDIGDFIYDSGVFLKAQSFSSTKPGLLSVVIQTAKPKKVKEQCDSVPICVFRSDTTFDQKVKFKYDGAATRGLDYRDLPDSITIPRGQSSYCFFFKPIQDILPEDDELFIITITNNPAVCTAATDFLKITDVKPFTKVKIKVSSSNPCTDTVWHLITNSTDGTPNKQFEWSSGAKQDSTKEGSDDVSPDTPRTRYTVKATDLCTGEVHYDTIYLDPIVKQEIQALTALDSIVCAGSTITLRAKGGVKYKWKAFVDGSPASVFVDNNDSIPNPKVVINDDTEFFVTSQDSGKCPVPAFARVLVPKFKQFPPDKIVCPGQSVALQVKGFRNETFTWSPNTFLNKAIGDSVVCTPTDSVEYTITATDTFGCVFTRKVKVYVDSVANAKAGPDIYTCRFTTVPLQGSGGRTLIWSGDGINNPNGSNTEVIAQKTGIIVVTAYNGSCFDTDTLNITVIDSVGAAFEYMYDSCASKLYLTDKSQAASILWVVKKDTFTTRNPVVTFTEAGSYIIKQVVNSGTECADSTEKSLQVHMAIPSTFEYPNVFTPNGDEINDKFVIKGFNAACVIDAITIFNRWGERVHKGTDIEHFSWDGKVNEGADAEDGVYFYVVEGKGFKKTGNVTLQR